MTLIELVASIVAVGLILYAALAIYLTSNIQGTNIKIFFVAQSLAEGKLEEKMAMSFDGLTNESRANYSGDLGQYSYQVAVDYVSPEALDSSAGQATAYKKISVMISHPKLQSPIQLESLRSEY